jgi:2-polyprenyl-6-hydroxyphenyl methylase / 3-demethylubiquinone-9 3-methyltransferase
VPVDNQLYDRFADTWWNDDSSLAMLRTAVNPARFGYMRGVLEEKLHVEPRGLRVLDVGCGGGLLAEEFARLGCRVTGVDPSEESLATARAHARQEGLEIEYVAGVGERLPFDDGAFQAAYCCDVLEHVDDVGQTVAESARVLAPGGVYMFDTVNRTVRSKLLFITVFQEWRRTAFMEPNVHSWEMFIKPRELEGHLRQAGLEPRECVGLQPARNALALLPELRRRVRGEISYAELGRRVQLRVGRDRSGLYAGYALKAA